LHISRLELFGFKSFANKTTLHFDKGVTGIVGPNGCGKTNTVDAIRWVLGEQKSSTLRSDKMENVIFNGTKTKKPLGMSEVSITFVNDDNTLPTDYSEVTITRRIFRSGESEYLLNKNVCRLKDITNLFMDTGMATNAYSVIELKMVEGILNDKTGERRKMFEEAAGVNKYKHRRKISLKKLEEVKSDLTRVNDIISEVQKNVVALERQAKKADKFNILQTELREKEINYSERRFTILISRIEELTSGIEILQHNRELTDSQIHEIELKLISIRDIVLEIERSLRIKQTEIGKINEQFHQFQQEISVAAERDKSLSQNIERYKSEVEELNFQNEENQFNVDDSYQNILKFEQIIDLNKSEFEQKLSKVEKDKVILSEKQNHLKLREEILKNHEISLNQKNNEILSLHKNVESTQKRVEILYTKIQEWTDEIAKTVGLIDELNEAKILAENLLAEREKEYVSFKNEKENLGLQVQELFEKETNQRSFITALEDKIDFVNNLIENLEGVSKGSKVLISNNEWNEKDKTLFADVGKTDDKFRYALEAALKKVLNNLLIEDLDSLNKAIDYLKTQDLGKASFFLLGNFSNQKKSIFEKFSDYFDTRKIKLLEKENGFVDWTINHVQTEEKWHPYFQKILFKTAIVTTISTAIEMTKKFPEFTFVTLDGDLIQADGIIDAGSLPKLDDTLFGRKQLVVDLQRESENRKIELEKVVSEKNRIQAQFDSIDLDMISEKGKRVSLEIVNFEKQIARLESESEKFSEQIQNSETQISSELHEIENSNLVIEELKQTAEILEKQKSEVLIEISKLQTDYSKFEENFNILLQAKNDKSIELEKAKGLLRNEHNKIEQIRANLRNIEDALKKRKENIQQSEIEIAELKVRIEERTLELDELKGERNSLYESRKEIEEKLSEVRQNQTELETQVQKYRNERTNISDKIHTYDLEINKLTFEFESLHTHIREEYSIELEKKEFEDIESFDFPNTKQDISNLREKIKSLGPINTLAYAEYEEQKDRYDFLVQQKTDLIESEKDLVKTINEINETAQQQFVETFEQIRQNFKKTFQTLFDPEDEADLVMEDNDDPLEARINITAKPKGKRPTSIELLSGGEKTLTATALLFAFYLVKPSPFCILDEVDAPLDDANIDRFTKLIRKFSENTQFIIVTHNKNTMVFTDAIYGVTMVEDGISKLAGIKFDEKLGAN